MTLTSIPVSQMRMITELASGQDVKLNPHDYHGLSTREQASVHKFYFAPAELQTRCSENTFKKMKAADYSRSRKGFHLPRLDQPFPHSRRQRPN